MSQVSEHYENLLADCYSWMFGDFNGRVEANRIFFERSGIVPAASGIAVDLGAGPGFQSIALGRLGFRVTAIDLSQKLLDELKKNSAALPVTTVRDDLLNVAAHCPEKIELCVCMGDTLPHLQSLEEVTALFERVNSSLEQRGTLVLTFRDLAVELKGLDRFIPVRSDADTLFTCFLEYGPAHVQVHDLVYARKQEAWEFRKSSYRKLRIPFDWTILRLKAAGFTVKAADNSKGMITIIAGKTG